jgi:hypothetical protein
MRCRGALFDSTDVQDSVFQIDLLPPFRHGLRASELVDLRILCIHSCQH